MALAGCCGCSRSGRVRNGFEFEFFLGVAAQPPPVAPERAGRMSCCSQTARDKGRGSGGGDDGRCSSSHPCCCCCC
jgi:hypothetical protein